MEGGEGDLLGLLGINHTADTLTHLLGGLVGEGDGEDRGGIHPMRDKPGDARRQDSGLSRARPRKDEHRPLPVRGRAVLLGVEIKEAERRQNGKDEE